MQDTGADIAIVGAGIAGLSAALALVEHHGQAPNRPRIVILEAGETVGGRTRTVTAGNGNPVDLGAHWFHGGEANPFFQWVRARYRDRLSFVENPHDPRFALTVGAAEARYRDEGLRRLRNAYNLFKSARPDEDCSLAALARQAGDPQAQAVAGYFARNWMAVESPDLVSADEFFGDPFGPGGIQVVGGIGQVATLMAAELDQAGLPIEMRRRVVAIEQSGAGCVLTTADGTACRTSKAIVTVAAGVLQQGGIRFDPPLTAAARGHIDDLGIACLTKIILPVRPEFFTERAVASDTHVSLFRAESSLFCHVRSTGSSTVTIFGGGDFARYLETLPRDQVAGLAFEALDTVPQLAGVKDHLDGEVIVTGWNTDPLFHGSYTAIRPGARRCGPLVEGRIVLAGEAFVDAPAKGPSMMIGAWYSGREAAALLDTI
ncbi:MAG TPA: NAD(P)/FAD-dependent oxidoreductase [Aliidongia sp.]|nr:NAD(P)/FAD-dependent oxidoreductase [Aliidongia sp.]